MYMNHIITYIIRLLYILVLYLHDVRNKIWRQSLK